MTEMAERVKLIDLLNQMSESTRGENLDLAPEKEMRRRWEETVHNLKESRYKTDTRIRIFLAIATQLLIIFRVVLISIVLLRNNRCYHLSDTAICAFLGAATANVVGLAAIVLNGFFKFMKQDVDL